MPLEPAALRLRRDRRPRTRRSTTRELVERRAARRRPPQRDRRARRREREGLEAVSRADRPGRPRPLGHEPRPQLRRARASSRWLCDARRGAARRASRARYPRARVTADFDELLADAELDAVVVATPVPTHYELAKQALEAGKHVFVEKPPAMRGGRDGGARRARRGARPRADARAPAPLPPRRAQAEGSSSTRASSATCSASTATARTSA